MKWEYTTSPMDVNRLNQLGREGWEAVGIVAESRVRSDGTHQQGSAPIRTEVTSYTLLKRPISN